MPNTVMAGVLQLVKLLFFLNWIKAWSHQPDITELLGGSDGVDVNFHCIHAN